MDKTEQNILKEKMNRIEELKELGYGNMIIEKNSLQEKAILEAEIRGYQLAQKETAEKVKKFISEIKTICPNSLFNKEVDELKDKIFNEDKK